jgi:HEAT repeat protein
MSGWLGSTAPWLKTAAAIGVIMAAIGCRGDGQDAAAPAAVRPPADWSSKYLSAGRRGTEGPQPPNRPPFTAEEMRQLRAESIDLLKRAAESTNALLRANAIEALHLAPEELPPIVQLGLGDENRGVRFVAAMTVGRLQIRSLADLVTPLLHDPSDSVRAAAIYALRRCGRTPSLDPLATMIVSSDPEVKGNAALVLGELGDPSAIGMLREAGRIRSARVLVARARIVELQIAEAMVKLGQEGELEVIRAALFAPEEQAELAALACMMCGRLRDEAYIAPMREMALRMGRDQEPAEVRLAAAQAVAQIDPARAPLGVLLMYVEAEAFALRAQAAAALGWVQDPSVPLILAEMLEDPNPLVQVAAAGSILRHTAG